eukprot:1865664-Ditylum_brightwellii.AAC.1
MEKSVQYRGTHAGACWLNPVQSTPLWRAVVKWPWVGFVEPSWYARRVCTGGLGWDNEKGIPHSKTA